MENDSRPLLTLLVLAVAAALLNGCSPGGPPKYLVTGTVTWEGQPLSNGNIVFAPLDTDYAYEAGEIKDGRFSFESTAGQKRVEIQASREIAGGQVDPSMGAVRREAFIPDRYNTSSTVQIEVKAVSENKFDFPLTATSSP